MDKIFINNLKQIRKERHKTQKQTAEHLKVVESCYANWEQGRTQPSIEAIREICKYFEVSADYLLGLEDETGAKMYNKDS